MADPHYILEENPAYNEAIRALQDSDPARASTTFNPLLLEMLNNTHHVKKALDTAVCDLETKASDTDLVALGDAIEQVIAAHTGNSGIHVSLTEKAAWDAKETPAGAQEKANAVQASLNEHAADQSNPHAVNNEQLGAVPTSRKIAGKPLNTDVTLGALTFAGAVTGAYDGSEAKTITIPEGGGKRTVRFVVGTSTAGWTEKDCDYLCDGVADDVEINAAIQALPANGGEILILDGTYSLDSNIEMNRENTTLSGSNDSSILLRNYDSTDSGDLSYIISIGKSRCKVMDLMIDGNRDIYTGRYNSGIKTSRQSSTTGNITITNVTIKNCEYQGIKVESTVGAYIINNRISGCGGTGISVSSWLSTSDIIVHGNTLSGNSAGINTSQGVQRCSITENICKNNERDGIEMRGNNGETATVCVSGNVCSGNKLAGIGILQYSSANIVGNVCVSNEGSGIDIVIDSMQQATSKNILISGNICAHNLRGIRLLASPWNSGGVKLATISNNAITGNVCNQNTEGIVLSTLRQQSSYGVIVNNTITGNTCNDNKENGIRIGDVNSTTAPQVIEKNNISGNTCIRGTGSPSDYDATQFTIKFLGTYCNHNLIANNLIMGKNYLTSGGANNTFVNNKYN